jgi:hypothetical protein
VHTHTHTHSLTHTHTHSHTHTLTHTHTHTHTHTDTHTHIHIHTLTHTHTHTHTHTATTETERTSKSAIRSLNKWRETILTQLSTETGAGSVAGLLHAAAGPQPKAKLGVGEQRCVVHRNKHVLQAVSACDGQHGLTSAMADTQASSYTRTHGHADPHRGERTQRSPRAAESRARWLGL